MDNEMIERCKTALDAKFGHWTDAMLTDIVIATIKAMREPTDKMMVAAEHAFPLLLTFADKEESGSYIAWQAMIDCIIND